MKIVKNFIFGVFLAVFIMFYPVYSFYQDEPLANVTPPSISEEEAHIRSYYFYEGEHYRLTDEEIARYMKDIVFNLGNPMKTKPEETIIEPVSEEVANILKGMHIPVDEEYFEISSNFGMRTDPISGEEEMFHWGVDIAAPGIEGSPVYASMDGVVEFAAERNSFGNLVILSHHSGRIKTYYAHLETIEDLVPGDAVRKGQQIGTVGNTGRSTGPHLHFEVHVPMNPLEYFDRVQRAGE